MVNDGDAQSFPESSCGFRHICGIARSVDLLKARWEG